MRYKDALYVCGIGCITFLLALQASFIRGDREAIIFGDAEGYYLYLPSMVIYGNFKDYPIKTYDASLIPNHEIKNKYTCGVAMLQAPFFLMADTFVRLTKTAERNGISWPYIVSVLMSGAFYLALGCYFLLRLLSTRFSFLVSLLAVLALWLGTNLYYYTALRPGMSHVYSFFLFSAFIYTTHLFWKKPLLKRALCLGILLGLITLVRPTNVMVVLVFLMYNASGWPDIKDRILLLFKKPQLLLILFVAAFCVFIPQAWYWKETWGSWIYYSYGNESFIYWDKPKILKVLFGVMNGWLLYSPMAIIALLGLPKFIKKEKLLGWSVVVVLILATYSFASWWAWWFGGAFGHRCYVEFYALFAIPMAFSLNEISKKQQMVKVVFAIACALLVYYNLGLSYLYDKTLPWDGPDWGWPSYWDRVSAIF